MKRISPLLPLRDNLCSTVASACSPFRSFLVLRFQSHWLQAISLLLLLSFVAALAVGQVAPPPEKQQSPAKTPPKSRAGLANVDGEHLTIYWSEEKDFICGLSKALDKYDQITINPPATDEPTPLVIGHIAVWSDRKNIHAFSAKTAKWDTLKLPENSSPRLTLENNLPVVTSGDKVFHFTADDGKWAPQNAAATAVDPATVATTSPGAPQFVATLLTIKADWSQLPAAKEIDAEFRQALSGEVVPEELLTALPGSGATILFPVETVSYYTADHYAQLLAWLTMRGIALATEEAPSAPGQGATGQPGGGGTLDYAVEAANLTKDVNFLGFSVNPATSAQPFITRKGELNWHVQNHQRELSIQRNVRVRESSRGEAEPKIESVDSCSVRQPTLKGGQVLIVPAFPSNQDWQFRNAAREKGIDLLLVIEQRAPGAAPKAEGRLVLPDKVERIKAEKTKNAGISVMGGGMGGMGGGMVGTGSVLSIQSSSNQNPARLVSSGNIMISWSEAKDTAWGFSKSLGKWARQELNPPATGPRDVPVVGDNVAVWWVGSKYYGYSSEAGRWDVLNLPEGHTPPPVLDSGFARVNDGDDIYTFAATTGRWSSPQGKESAIETPAAEKSDQIKIFTVRNARAADLQRVMSDLYGREGLTLTVDERTNSLIARGPAELLDIAYAILTKLDEELKPTDKPRTTTDETSVSIAEQSKQYEAKDQQAAKLAQELREAKNPSSAEKTRLQSNLRRAVADSFAARQKLHQAELAHLTARIRGIEQTIAARQKIADQIIDRRLEDLLNPNLQWDAHRGPGYPPGVSASREESAAQDVPSTTDIDPLTAMQRLDPVKYAGIGAKDDEAVIWNMLGIRGETVARKSLPNSPFDHGLMVNEVRPNGPASQLRVGDIIVGLHEWKLGIESELAWALKQPIAKNLRLPKPKPRSATVETTLYFLRDDEPHSIRVTLPPWPAESTTGISESAPRITVGPYVPPEIEEIWKVLGIKVRQLTFEESKEKDKPRGSFVVAEIYLDLPNQQLRVGDIIVSVQVRGGSRGSRIAELQILRGDETFPLTVESRPDASPSPSLSANPSIPARSSTLFSEAERFQQSIVDAENALEAERDADLSAFVGDNEREQAETKTWRVRSAQRRLDFIREEYTAQLRLLELDLQDAQSALDSAASDHATRRKAFESGQSTSSPVVAAQRAEAAARLRLEKAKTLLDLYRKADPKPPATDPANEKAKSD